MSIDDRRRARQWAGTAGRAAAVLGCIFLCLVAAECAPVVREIPPDAPSPVSLEEIRALDGGRIDVLPRLVHYTPPEYPQQAIFDGITGAIRLKAEVDEQGRVGGIDVLRSLPIFDVPCIEAMQTWRFAPALRDGRSVAFTVEVPFTFRIQP